MQEQIKNMLDAVKEGNINSFETNFTTQAKENIGKGIETHKETIAGTMFKQTEE